MTLECVTGLTTKINPKTMRMLDAAHHAPHAAIQQYSNTEEKRCLTDSARQRFNNQQALFPIP
ncbi:hypothetical protein [Bifidobacterium longum]|uniref:hypothetical protein n=1 Tax=Bifidobacterium longum TaxID=216816 RepID=UPI0011787AAF|nr:hypothetical protein [Bifidobacterium longum]MDU3566125.1 hypothetical protein [Bifidobacterium longum]MDU6623561.1 hypothetical protein [Bifidobacterium longum]MDW3163765.1 hypothetical protein [Bifidobacterium longum]